MHALLSGHANENPPGHIDCGEHDGDCADDEYRLNHCASYKDAKSLRRS